MKGLTQQRCNEIACKLNNRPRKRYGFITSIQKLQQYLPSIGIPRELYPL
jgi:IS30 family transposase